MRYPAIRCAALLGLVLGASLAARPATAQEPDMASIMEAYDKAATPGEAHAWLARQVGDWKSTVKLWMDPTAEPTISEARSKIEMVMGGRFLREQVEGTFMGQPFSGVGLTGYNNVTGQYEATWIDNQSTPVYYYTGALDGNVLVFHSEYTDPASGEVIKTRSTIEMTSPDQMIARGFEVRDGSERQVMELVYERVK